MTIYNQPALTKIPGYFTIQAHPDHEVMPVIARINALFPEIQEQLWASRQEFYSPAPQPNPVFQEAVPGRDATMTELYNFDLSRGSMIYLIDALGPYTPASIVGYLTAVHYAETHLLSLKIADLTPDAILEILSRINHCMSHGEFNGGIYRASDCVIFTDQMPEVRNEATFLQMHRQIESSADEEQGKLWKNTSIKVWFSFFSANPRGSSFDPLEKALLREFMEFKPEHQQIPSMMDAFANDFCAKVAAGEPLDLLCSWAHQRLVEIHPYIDGNGRTARFWMNLTRMWVGEKPLLFDNVRNYTQAVRNFNPQKFLDYLQELKAKQIDLDPFLDQCLQSIYEGSLVAQNCDLIMQRVLRS